SLFLIHRSELNKRSTNLSPRLADRTAISIPAIKKHRSQRLTNANSPHQRRFTVPLRPRPHATAINALTRHRIDTVIIQKELRLLRSQNKRLIIHTIRHRKHLRHPIQQLPAKSGLLPHKLRLPAQSNPPPLVNRPHAAPYIGHGHQHPTATNDASHQPHPPAPTEYAYAPNHQAQYQTSQSANEPQTRYANPPDSPHHPKPSHEQTKTTAHPATAEPSQTRQSHPTTSTSQKTKAPQSQDSHPHKYPQGEAAQPQKPQQSA